MNHLNCDNLENGLLTSRFESETMIWSQKNKRIIVVDNLSPNQERIRARQIGQIANRELQHDGGIYNETDPPDFRDIHLYLYVSDSRAIGLSIFERRDNICEYTWEEYDRRIQKDLKLQNPIWSLGLIWIHKNYRKCGIATQLFENGLAHLNTGINKIGLYTPFSEEGRIWARTVFENEFIIAK